MSRFIATALLLVLPALAVASGNPPTAKPIRIVLVGDSTVASYAKPPADKPDLTGWGQVFGDLFNDRVTVLNHAKSGRSTRSFIKEGLWKTALAEKGDYIFIQFGHNDSHLKDGKPAVDPATDFQSYLRQYIDEARAGGAKPILVTPVARRTFKDGKIVTGLQPYADAMLKVGKEKGVPVIDLHAAAMRLFDRLGDAGSADMTASASDRTHFSHKGAEAMARLVVEALPKAVPELKPFLKPVVDESSAATNDRAKIFARPSSFSGQLKVQIDGPLLVNFPVLLKLTVVNTGKTPFSFWYRGSYPNACLFWAAVTDHDRHTRHYLLQNEATTQGSGNDNPVETMLTLPAVFDSLPAGNYTLKVGGESRGYVVRRDANNPQSDLEYIETSPKMSSEEIPITVKEDAIALANAENELLARAKPWSFAEHVAQVCSIGPTVKTWLEQLLNDDPEVAWESIGRLQHVLRLPPGGDVMLQQAARKHSRLEPSRTVNGLLDYITLIAAHIGTDGSLEAALIVARSAKSPEARAMAIDRVSWFAQKKAETELLTFLNEKDTRVFRAALFGLANRHNVAALAPLLRAASDKDVGQRSFAVRALRGLKDYPAARDVVATALSDPSPAVRDAAHDANRSDKEQSPCLIPMPP